MENTGCLKQGIGRIDRIGYNPVFRYVVGGDFESQNRCTVSIAKIKDSRTEEIKEHIPRHAEAISTRRAVNV